MISTVTTSTITTISTITATGTAVIVVVVLIAFLITKELAATANSTSPQHVARYLNIGILPLLMIFAVTVSVKIAAILA